MQYLPLTQVARRILRAAICPSCYQRQPHDDLIAPSVPRPCEAQCALFRHVPVLIGIAADHRADDARSSVIVTAATGPPYRTVS
jgi:hypothetical protein